jgi:hypothetical protein
MSSHDAHLTREEVVDRVLDVLKSHPKVDPAKVTPSSALLPFRISSRRRYQTLTL